MRYIILQMALFVLLYNGFAIAGDSIHCRGKIIDVGMTSEEVRKHCGKPDYENVDIQSVHSGNRVTGETPVTTWHYNQPGGLLIAVLVFDVDKLRSIELVDKMEEDF